MQPSYSDPNNLLLKNQQGVNDEVVMSKDRLAELAEKLSDQMASVEETKAEMLEILTGKATSVVVRAAPKKMARKPTAPRVATDDQPNGDRQPSLKEIVLGILEKDGPVELKKIVVVVQAMIKAGEYKSKATKLTPVVSQALFQLKSEKLVATSKATDEDGRTRNLYSVASA